MQHQPETSPEGSELYRILTGQTVGMDVRSSYGVPATYDLSAAAVAAAAAAAAAAGVSSFSGSSFYPFEMSDITDVPQARALAASKNHREAEKRRRERINSHLNKLRSLLPCNSKTDKASLLAKVIQHVKELKQQTMEIAELELFPSETDEIAVYSLDMSSEGRPVLKASLCCEDRSDLLPELMETLKSLRLKTLRAEMATLGGRIRNVLIVTGEEDEDPCKESISYLREALKNLVDRSSCNDRLKRRRIFECRTSTTTTTTED